MACALLPHPLVRWWWWCGALLVAVGSVEGGAADGTWVNARPVRIALAADGSPARPVVRIERVRFTASPPTLTLTLSAPAPAVAKPLPAIAGAPARIYVDVPGATLAPSVPAQLAGGGAVARVRAGQFDRTTARVILDLRRPAEFALTTHGRTVSLALRGAGPPRGAATDASARPGPEAKVRKPVAAKAAASDPSSERAREAAAPVAAAPKAQEPASAPKQQETAAAPNAEKAVPPKAQEAAAAPVPAPALPAPAAPAAATLVLPAPPVSITSVNGRPFIWPPLDAAEYADPAADPLRAVVAASQAGTAPATRPTPPARSPAALFLAADVAYLDAATRGRGFFDATTAYERALREAPEFADAPRALFLLGQASLALGFGPEATAAFQQLERRFPDHSLADDARIGRAAALRLRHRHGEASRLLAEVVARAHGGVRCRALREQALAAGTPLGARSLFARLAETCPDEATAPDALQAHAEARVAEGDRDGARALLAAPRPPARADQEARLALLAASLEPDASRARAEYRRIAALELPPALAIEAAMRLAVLDGADDPERGAAALVALARQRGPSQLRARVLGEAAELTARAGRFDAALGLLDRAAALGPAGTAEANARRGRLLGSWIGTLAARDDVAGVATVYAAQRTAVHETAGVEDRVTVARALGRVGLHARAVELLSLTAEQSRSPLAAVALAEAAVAGGDVATARAALARLDGAVLDDALAARRAGLAARLALAAGDLDAAAAAAARSTDAGARAAVAGALLDTPDGAARAAALIDPVAAASDAPVVALLTAGRAALATGRAADAVALARRALAAATGAERTAAAALLLRSATAAGDRAAALEATAAMAAVEDPALRRAAEAARRTLVTGGRSSHGG